MGRSNRRRDGVDGHVEPFTITTATTHGFEVGMVLHLSAGSGRGKNYRIVEVISATQIRVDRPWWLPFKTLWSSTFGRWLRRLRLYL